MQTIEEFKEQLHSDLDNFIESDESEISFSPRLGFEQRRLIHITASRMGLQHFSTGTEPQRYVTVKKPAHFRRKRRRGEKHSRRQTAPPSPRQPAQFVNHHTYDGWEDSDAPLTRTVSNDMYEPPPQPPSPRHDRYDDRNDRYANNRNDRYTNNKNDRYTNNNRNDRYTNNDRNERYDNHDRNDRYNNNDRNYRQDDHYNNDRNDNYDDRNDHYNDKNDRYNDRHRNSGGRFDDRGDRSHHRNDNVGDNYNNRRDDVADKSVTYDERQHQSRIRNIVDSRSDTNDRNRQNNNNEYRQEERYITKRRREDEQGQYYEEEERYEKNTNYSNKSGKLVNYTAKTEKHVSSYYDNYFGSNNPNQRKVILREKKIYHTHFTEEDLQINKPYSNAEARPPNVRGRGYVRWGFDLEMDEQKNLPLESGHILIEEIRTPPDH